MLTTYLETKIEPYKNRILDTDKPVRLYRNLTKKGVWYSLVQDGKTVAHTSSIVLKDCTFHVNEKSRQRVIRRKRKEFHAYIEGIITESLWDLYKAKRFKWTIRYNPFKNSTFVSDFESEVHKAWLVSCDETGVKGFMINNDFF